MFLYLYMIDLSLWGCYDIGRLLSLMSLLLAVMQSPTRSMKPAHVILVTIVIKYIFSSV